MTNEMEQWVYYAMDAVQQAAMEDSDYQELNEKREALACAYEEILQELSEEKREVLVSYQYYAEEMLFQKIRLAFFLGKKQTE